MLSIWSSESSAFDVGEEVDLAGNSSYRGRFNVTLGRH